MSKHRLQLNQFYRVTWQLLLLTTCLLGVFSQLARPMVLAGYFLLGTLMVSRPTSIWLQYRRALSLAIGGSLLILVSQQALAVNSTEGFISILIEIISGSLPWLLMSHDRYRSYWLAVLNTTVIAIGAMTVGTTAMIYLGFLVFIIFLLLSLNAANLYFSTQDPQHRRDTLPQGYFRQFIYVIPVGILAGAVIFVLFPRVQSFSWSITRGRGDNYTGYTGLVSLNADGELRLSHALNLMLESEDEVWLKQASYSLLLKGDSLDIFDGTQWRSSVSDYKYFHATTDFDESEATDEELADVKNVVIHLEPSILNHIFYPGRLLSIRSVDTPNVHFVINHSGQVIRDPHSNDRLSYEVQFVPYSDSLVLESSPVNQRSLSPEDRARHLEVPRTILDAKYFKDWLSEVRGNNQNLNLPTVSQRIHRIFHGRFRPTLANSFTGTNALEAFLTKERQGHCEYFATVATLTLRAMGYPARMVVGYRGGLFNDVLGTLDVRDEDAHAWVEVFHSTRGWVPFDPTPSTSDPMSPYQARWQILVNSFNFWLHRYVIDYDQSTQRELWQEIRSLGQRGPDLTPDIGAIAPFYIWAFGTISGVAVFVVLIRSRSRRRTSAALPKYYQRFVGKLAKLHLARERGESFASFHRRVAPMLADRHILVAVDQAIHAELYGTEPVSNAERAKLAGDIRRWRPRLA